MPLKLEKWFLAQCHRDDPVGQLARLWLEQSHEELGADTQAWLDGKGSEAEWRDAAYAATREYAIAVACLKEGKSSPTFRRLFASAAHEEALKRSAEDHRNNPEVSPELHLRRRHLGLLKALEGRALVYLDTNHWINLRHVVMKSHLAKPAYAEILKLINELALTRRLLCPISFPLFLELMKQLDQTTRLATARLMDCFSGGVCFQFPLDIERLELRQKILQSVLRDKAPDLSDQVWTKVGYVNGELLPFNKLWSKEYLWFVQKLSMDGMWALPLEHFAEFDPAGIPSLPHEKLAEATNTDALWYRSEKIPFGEVFTREKAFLLRSLLPEMEKIVKEVWDDYPMDRDVSRFPAPSEKDASPWVIPSVQVLAGINAAFIVSPKRFTPNDILDLRHAALAIPYCDALFCDGAMAHVLNSKPLDFANVYGTAVMSRPDEIIHYLERLNAKLT